MGVEISRKEFAGLKSHQRDLVVFDNLTDIKKAMHSWDNCKAKTEIKNIRNGGIIWLTILTIALGLKKYLPF